MQILKASHFRPPCIKQVNSDPWPEITSSSISHTEIKSISTTQTKAKSISMLTLKPSDLRPASKNESISTTTTHTKTKSINHTQNKLISAGTRSISIPRTKNKSRSIPRLDPAHKKSSYFRRHQWNQVNSIPTLKSSQFRCLHTKTKLISIHTINTKYF